LICSFQMDLLCVFSRILTLSHEKELACTKTDICSTKESFDTENLEIIIKLQNNMDCNRESRRENGRFY
jgi:hypothetical protein